MSLFAKKIAIIDDIRKIDKTGRKQEKRTGDLEHTHGRQWTLQRHRIGRK